MINHSPHRAVSPGPYLFQVRVFLRDFPHRAVNFFTGEMCPSLHDEEEQAKLQKTSTSSCVPVTRSEGKAKHSLFKYQLLRLTSHFR